MADMPLVNITGDEARPERDELEQVVQRLQEDPGIDPELRDQAVRVLRGDGPLLSITDHERDRLARAEDQLAVVHGWIEAQLDHPHERISPAYAGRSLALLLGQQPGRDPGRYWRPGQVIGWRDTMGPS